MPFAVKYLLPKNFSLFQVEKFIPKKWKQSVKVSDIQNNIQSLISSSHELIVGTHMPYDESMVDCLLLTLKNFVSQGHLAKAVRTFGLFQLHVPLQSPCDIVLQSLSSLLLCCTNLKSFSEGKQLHAYIITSGLARHRMLVPKIVTFYTTFDLLFDAHKVTETSNILHPLPWNLLISSYVKNRHYEEALSAYKQMVSKGIWPDNFTYPSVLKACGEQVNLAFGREVHKSIDASSQEKNLFVQNALVSMYAKCGELDVAHDIFEQMPVKDAVSWNSIISGYASNGIWSKAIDLFENMMANGIELNIITWNTVAGGCSKTGNFTGTFELLSRMRNYGFQLDPVAVLIGLGACSQTGLLRLGKEIHCLAIRNYFENFDNVTNALITMYARCKGLKQAYILFQLKETKTIVSWNSIISGFSHWDKYEETSFLFREMLFSGFDPNFVTIASILPLCARVANLQHGREFHCYITRHEGFEEQLLLWNALLDMYARSGKVSVAKKLFDSMRKKDTVTYTSLIAGYGILGEGKAAIKLFEDMIRSQLKPDHVTMVAVLSACSHSGLVMQGEKLYEQMQSVYGISPQLEHFSCMADLFGRSGLLKKAVQVLKKMPFEPTAAMWATLIGACRIHGNTEIGEWAAEKLLEMRPDNSGYYVLIANMYAAAGCWNKLAKVRTLMRDSGVRKDPGCAWINMGAGFSSFMVADTSNSQRCEIYSLLGGLTRQIKDASYVANEESAFSEEAY
nr:pentatricopeptide repeat-containing protein At1g71490-like [Ipomoea batatas]